MKVITRKQIEDCLRGDREAQKIIFETLYSSMFRLCQRYLANKSEAEDCLMRGMMRIFQRLDTFKFKDDYSLFMWSRKVMVNEALMALRKRTNFFLISEGEVPDYFDATDILNKMESVEIFNLILKLPDGYRTVFNLFVVEGYSHKEISELLGISESTSKTQYRKAKARLKEMLLSQDKNHYGTFGK